MLDRLDRKIYAEKIADEIKNHYEAQQRGDEEDGIVFAVSARWGEGKTFLLNSLEPMLRESGFTVVRFNPWQYSQEDISLKRAFLKILKDELRAEAIDLDDLYYDRSTTALDWRSFLPRVIRFLFWGFMATYIAPLIFGAEASSWWPTLNKALTSFWSSGVGGVLLAVFILPLLLKTITVSSRKAQVATAEEFDTKFKTLLSGHKKVVVFVDDLDRCTPSTVKTVLDSLKTFFNHPECSYVITGDHTVIERYAAEELNPSKKEIEPRDIEEGRRFLKKLFNVYWRLPLSTPKKFSGFVSDEINKVDLVLKETQKKRIEAFMLDDKFLERNPRHVKRFVLSLKFALQSVQ